MPLTRRLSLLWLTFENSHHSLQWRYTDFILCGVITMEKPTDPALADVSHDSPASSRRTLATVIGFIAVILVIVLAVAQFMMWQRLTYQSQVQQHQLLTLQGQTGQQQRHLSALQQGVAAVLQTTSQKESGWRLAEADYLIRLAHYNLEFSNNVAVAVKLLRLADLRLSVIENTAVVSVRRALANQLVALAAVPKVDIAGLVLRIDALSQHIPKLPLLPNQLPQQKAATTEAQHTKHTWRSHVDRALAELKTIVVVRHLHKPGRALLSPQQQTYLVENIQLTLSQAAWAVLHRRPQIYRHSLLLVHDWIQRYFIQSSSATQSVLSDLTRLANINIKPALPSMAAVMKAMAMAKVSGHVATPVKNAPPSAVKVLPSKKPVEHSPRKSQPQLKRKGAPVDQRAIEVWSS